MIVVSKTSAIDLNKFDGLKILSTSTGEFSLSAVCRSYTGEKHTLDISLYVSEDVEELQELMNDIADKWSRDFKTFDIQDWLEENS